MRQYFGRLNYLIPVFLPLLLVACTAIERAEVAKDFHDIAVPALTNPANYSSPTALIGAGIGVLATIATNYIKRKFWDKK
jgi:hypothetical protein